MRIAVISDLHGNLPALESCLEDMRAAQVDLVINLGDSLSGPLWLEETARVLRSHDWPTLAGNHERQVLTLALQDMSAADAITARAISPDTRQWMGSLPPTAWLGNDVFACHGTPTSDLHYLLETVTPDFDQARGSPGIRMASAEEVQLRLAGSAAFEARTRPAVILCGHSHVPRLMRLPPQHGDAQGTLVLNPGSLGQPAFDDEHPHSHWVENAAPHARYALLDHQGEHWSASLRALAYDWAASARRAEQMGRGDWADALRTGRVGRTEAQAIAAQQAPSR